MNSLRSVYDTVGAEGIGAMTAGVTAVAVAATPALVVGAAAGATAMIACDDRMGSSNSLTVGASVVAGTTVGVLVAPVIGVAFGVAAGFTATSIVGIAGNLLLATIPTTMLPVAVAGHMWLTNCFGSSSFAVATKVGITAWSLFQAAANGAGATVTMPMRRGLTLGAITTSYMSHTSEASAALGESAIAYCASQASTVSAGVSNAIAACAGSVSGTNVALGVGAAVAYVVNRVSRS